MNQAQRVGAHARRKFDEALKALPDDKQKAAVTAREGLEFCNPLFGIEREDQRGLTQGTFESPDGAEPPRCGRLFGVPPDPQRPRVLPKSTLGLAACKLTIS